MKEKLFVIVAVMILSSVPVEAQDFFRTDVYAGVSDEQGVATFTGFKSLPKNFNVFGFVDFFSEEGGSETNFIDFYGETSLTYEFWGNWGIMTELDVCSQADSLGRLGVSYRPPILEDWGVKFNFLPYRSDNEGGQIGFSFYKDISKTFFVEGWGDLDLWRHDSDDSKRPDTTYMLELQVGAKIMEDLYLVAEYRLNDYVKGFRKTDSALGIGLEYRF